VNAVVISPGDEEDEEEEEGSCDDGDDLDLSEEEEEGGGGRGGGTTEIDVLIEDEACFATWGRFIVVVVDDGDLSIDCEPSSFTTARSVGFFSFFSFLNISSSSFSFFSSLNTNKQQNNK
jgi:hypothetical protein